RYFQKEDTEIRVLRVLELPHDAGPDQHRPSLQLHGQLQVGMHDEVTYELGRGVSEQQPGSAHVDDRGLVAALGAALHLEISVRDEGITEGPRELLDVLEYFPGEAFPARPRVPHVDIAHDILVVQYGAPQLGRDVFLGLLV